MIALSYGMAESMITLKKFIRKALIFPNIFEIGSLVKEVVDSRLSQSASCAELHCYINRDFRGWPAQSFSHCWKRNKRKMKRTDSEDRLQIAWIDGLDALSRLGSSNAIARKWELMIKANWRHLSFKGLNFDLKIKKKKFEALTKVSERAACDLEEMIEKAQSNFTVFKKNCAAKSIHLGIHG